MTDPERILAILGTDDVKVDGIEVHPVVLPRPDGAEPVRMVALMFRRADTGGVFWIPLDPTVAANIGVDLEHAAMAAGHEPGTDSLI